MPFRHLLVAIDRTEMSERAFAIAASLALRLDARLTAVHAVNEPVPSDMTFINEAALAGEAATSPTADRNADITGKVESLAAKAGIDCPLEIKRGTPWKAILAVAQERGCDLIVMATHGRHGVGALVIGSEAHEVMARAEVPVLACR